MPKYTLWPQNISGRSADGGIGRSYERGQAKQAGKWNKGRAARLFLGRYQAHLRGKADKAGGILYAQMPHELRPIRVIRLDTDVELFGDLFAGIAFRDQLQDFKLARCQLHA